MKIPKKILDKVNDITKRVEVNKYARNALGKFKIAKKKTIERFSIASGLNLRKDLKPLISSTTTNVISLYQTSIEYIIGYKTDLYLHGVFSAYIAIFVAIGVR